MCPYILKLLRSIFVCSQYCKAPAPPCIHAPLNHAVNLSYEQEQHCAAKHSLEKFSASERFQQTMSTIQESSWNTFPCLQCETFRRVDEQHGSSLHATTTHLLLRGWHHSSKGSAVEPRVRQPSAQLSPFLAERAGVAEEMGQEVTG